MALCINRTFLIFLMILYFSFSKDISTFSNYEIIRQKKVELHFDIDFNNKVIQGTEKIYFNALYDGEVIVLDTLSLDIISIIDSDTGDELEYILENQYEINKLGVPLKIYKEFSKDENLTILLKFNTTKEGMSLAWLDPEQTSGKIYPFMYSQGFPLLNRALFPIQDTPSVKVPYIISLTVEKPLLALNSGLFQSKIDNGDTVTYFYKQKIPIPSYLVAIAAGAIEERILSDRTKMYGEKEVVDLAVKEFEDIETFIEIAEAYISPYLWREYNVLIVAPSYPFGGMENPTLTFINPSFIAGDKSLTYVAAHEICHGWSGNLVTMDNWSDFWLNEGFTMFLQNKIFEKITDVDLKKLYSLVEDSALAADIIAFGESKTFTSLRPYLLGRDPNDCFSLVPYIKGYDFLYYLESIINAESNIDLFRKILRTYFDKYQYKSIKSEAFKELLIEVVKNELPPSNSSKILSKIDWDTWLEAPGFPPVQNDYSNKYTKEVEYYVTLFYANQLPDNFTDIFKGWHHLLKSYFLSQIQDTDKKLEDQQLSYLSYTLDLKEGYNVEINCAFFLIVLMHGKTLEEDVIDALDTFLGKYGRVNYVRPIYTELIKRDKPLAVKIFEKHRHFYHPTIVSLIERLIKTIN